MQVAGDLLETNGKSLNILDSCEVKWIFVNSVSYRIFVHYADVYKITKGKELKLESKCKKEKKSIQVAIFFQILFPV